MFLLSENIRREFLAVPQLVRIVMPSGGSCVPALLIKTSSLTLKYLVCLKTFKLIVHPIVGTGAVLYAVKVDDDPLDPAVPWSLVASDDELVALRSVIVDGHCDVFLYNEGGINVCGTSVEFNFHGTNGLTDVFAASDSRESYVSGTGGDLARSTL